MKEGYYSEYRGEEMPKRRNVVLGIIDIVITVLSVVVGVTMLMTYFVPYVNPGRIWFFPVLGLAAPAIYVATLILTLYWIIRWRLIRASLMTILVVVGFFKVDLYWRPEIKRNYDSGDDYDHNALKVMTYNVRSFYGEKGQSTVDEVLQLIAQEDPDIICLQELNPRLAEKSERFSLLDETYESARFGRTQAPDSLYGASMAILSKYHILRTGVILSPNTSVWADLLVKDDTLRVFNNHLKSTAITASDNEFITHRRFLSDTASEMKIRSIVTRLRENSVLRAEQVDSIAKTVRASHTTEQLVCGDFNDTPMSYVYRVMAKGLTDAFGECGSGYAHTFRGFYSTLRIDYVLSSENLEPISYEVIQVDYSDHHPVVVKLVKRP